MKNKKEREVEVIYGSGNVFADLGLKDAEGLFTRAELGAHLIKILRQRKYSQKEAAKILGLKQPEVSAIMGAKFNRFSQERLISFLNKLNQKVMIQISRHRKGQPYQQVTFAP